MIIYTIGKKYIVKLSAILIKHVQLLTTWVIQTFLLLDEYDLTMIKKVIQHVVSQFDS